MDLLRESHDLVEDRIRLQSVTPNGVDVFELLVHNSHVLTLENWKLKESLCEIIGRVVGISTEQSLWSLEVLNS